MRNWFFPTSQLPHLWTVGELQRESGAALPKLSGGSFWSFRQKSYNPLGSRFAHLNSGARWYWAVLAQPINYSDYHWKTRNSCRHDLESKSWYFRQPVYYFEKGRTSAIVCSVPAQQQQSVTGRNVYNFRLMFPFEPLRPTAQPPHMHWSAVQLSFQLLILHDRGELLLSLPHSSVIISQIWQVPSTPSLILL